MINPITETYQAIRAALLAYHGFTSLVKPGNFPDASDGKFQRYKESLSSADTPDVVLMQSSFSLRPFGSNSKAFTIIQTFPLLCTFELLQVVKPNELKLAIAVALLKTGDDLGLPYVRQWEIAGGTDDLSNKNEVNRNVVNFTSVLAITVQIELSRQLMLGL